MLEAVIGAILLSALAGGPTQDQSTALPEVTVTGIRSTPEETRRFVEGVSERAVHAPTLSTWRTPICLQVVNLREPVASTIMARIEDRAREVGVTVASPSCRPNITVLATSDGQVTASALVEAYRDHFIPSNEYSQGDGRDLRRFAETDAPVRWWQIAALIDDASGRVLVTPRQGLAERIDTTGEVYFGQNRRDAILTSLVILDLSRTEGATDLELGDYVAMVVLANIDPEADAGPYPTVLNLWRGGATGAGMTAWDRAYLKALYEAPIRLSGSEPPTRSLYQLNEMARIMSRELAEPASAP